LVLNGRDRGEQYFQLQTEMKKGIYEYFLRKDYHK